MLKVESIQRKYAIEEYEEHADFLNSDEDTSERFVEFLNENKPSLYRIYCQRVISEDDEATACNIIRWSQNQFLVWDCNNKLDSQLKSEMNDLIEGK